MIKYFSIYTVFVFLTFSLLAISGQFLSSEAFAVSLSEEGLWERLSAIIFVLGACLAGYGLYHHRTKLQFAFMSLMALASLREMDMHKEWTTDSILKSRFYLSDVTPISEKMIGLVVIFFLMFSIYILILNVKKWMKLLLLQDVIAWGVFLGLGSIVAGKFLDSFSRLFPFMVDFKKENRFVFLSMEEGFEFIGASVFLVTAYLLLRQLKYKINV